jgi:hypothetical protein
MFILEQLIEMYTFITNIINNTTEKIVHENNFDITKINQYEIQSAYDDNDEEYYGIKSCYHFYDGSNGYDS